MSHLTRKHLRVRGLGADERAPLDFRDFRLGTVGDYMEPPGSPEDAYRRYVAGRMSAADRRPGGSERG